MLVMTKNELYDKVRIPRACWDTEITLDSILKSMDKPSAANLNAFLNKESLGLFICGEDGNGKTTLASLVLMYLIDNRVQCFRGDITHFASSFKENDWAISPKYVQPTVVVIDDFLKMPEKGDFIQLNLERLIQYRIHNNRPLIVCSSGGLDIIAKKHSPNVAGLIKKSLGLVALKKSHY